MAIPFTLKQLRYVVAVADAGGISAAARQLHIAQPSVSAAVAQLERDFGIQLFIRRHARGIAVSPAGADFLVEARRLLEHAEELAANAADLGQSRRGPLALGCFSTLGPVYLPRLLESFARAEPAIEVHFQEAAIDELQERLIGGRCDLALLYEIDLSDQLTWTRLTELTSYVLLAADHPLAKKRKVPVEALAKLPLVLLDQPHSRGYFLSIFMAAGLEPAIRHRTTNVETIRGLVANGDCFSLLTLPVYSKTAYDGRGLVARPLAQPIPPLRIVLAWPKGARLTARAEAFAAHCRGFFGSA